MVKRYQSGKDNPDYEKNIWKPVIVIYGLVVLAAFVLATVKILQGIG